MKDENFRLKLSYALATAYTDADKCVSRKPHSFTTSLQERYAEAHAQGAKFFGPLAVLPVNGASDHFIIRDMRHGWGYHPINREFYVKEGTQPTVQDVILELKHYASWLRDHAEEIDEVTDLITQNAHPTE